MALRRLNRASRDGSSRYLKSDCCKWGFLKKKPARVAMIDSNPRLLARKSNALGCEAGSGQNPDNRETDHGRPKADNENVKRMAIGVVGIGVVGHSTLHQQEHEENRKPPPGLAL